MDDLAVTVPRAPARLRALGLESLYRLAHEPWRWRRQLALARFAILTGLTWLWRRGNRARRWVRMMTPQPASPPSPPPDGSAPVAGQQRGTSGGGSDRASAAEPTGEPAGSRSDAEPRATADQRLP